MSLATEYTKRRAWRRAHQATCPVTYSALLW